MRFFKARLGLKLAHKRITTKVVLPVSRVRVLHGGRYMRVSGEGGHKPEGVQVFWSGLYHSCVVKVLRFEKSVGFISKAYN